MRNHGIFKGLAIVLCALCLMTAALSGGSLMLLAAMNLEENVPPLLQMKSSFR